MALFIRQSEDRSKLQERLAAELREKAARNQNSVTQPDGVNDTQYLKDTKTTTSLAWVWIVVVILVIAGFAFYVFGSTK